MCANRAAVPTDRKPIANPVIVLREEYDDWAVLFNPDTGTAFGLNPTGVFVWKLLNGTLTEGWIMERLRGEVEGVPDGAEEQIARFMQRLVERGLAGYVCREGCLPAFTRNWCCAE